MGVLLYEGGAGGLFCFMQRTNKGHCYMSTIEKIREISCHMRNNKTCIWVVTCPGLLLLKYSPCFLAINLFVEVCPLIEVLELEIFGR